jgi:hypothetical protein
VRLARPEDYVNHSLYPEARTFLHDLPVVEDRMSMAHSVETWVPFLDNDLVGFARKVPVRLQLGNPGAARFSVRRASVHELTPVYEPEVWCYEAEDG